MYHYPTFMMSRKRYYIPLFVSAVLLCLLSGRQTLHAVDFYGSVGLESRLFPESRLMPEQFSHSNFSVAVKPELYHSWDEGYQSFTFAPFFRYDQHDNERTHFDIRELYWEIARSEWEFRAGIKQVFWGVTESQHLVDIINQTDGVEDLDGEAKLGQPMLQFKLIQEWATLDLYILPLFRERTFAGNEGRLRYPYVVDSDNPIYESDAEEKHIDWALRWYGSYGILDIGASFFAGTGREPTLVPGLNNDSLPVFVPRYDIIRQLGLSAQITEGGWLLKGEGIHRSGQGPKFYALTLGFEYTFADIGASGIDLGILGEYLFDERGDKAGTPFEDDIFVGTRLAFNDVQSTDVLAGVLFDRENGSALLNLEASRRIGESYKLNLRARGFTGVDVNDPFYSFRNDSYIQVELERYF